MNETNLAQIISLDLQTNEEAYVCVETILDVIWGAKQDFGFCNSFENSVKRFGKENKFTVKYDDGIQICTFKKEI